MTNSELSKPNNGTAVSSVVVLWGSETGNAENLAEETTQRLTQKGFTVECCALDDWPFEKISGIRFLVVITSTWGDGDPPSNGVNFVSSLSESEALDLSSLYYSVLALGDSAYPAFCQCGKNIHHHLKRLGANPLLDCYESDIDFEGPYEDWFEAVSLQLVCL